MTEESSVWEAAGGAIQLVSLGVDETENGFEILSPGGARKVNGDSEESLSLPNGLVKSEVDDEFGSSLPPDADVPGAEDITCGKSCEPF